MNYKITIINTVIIIIKYNLINKIKKKVEKELIFINIKVKKITYKYI